jgi:hypothetical protein
LVKEPDYNQGMNNCGCGNIIQTERSELGFKNCTNCAQAAYKGKPKGVMLWAHKTAPELQIMSSDSWQDQKKYYVPNGARSAVKNFSKNISR